MRSNCEECIGFDDALELPRPARTITNSRIEGILEIEQAFREDAHDFVSELPPTEPKPMVPEPLGMHGAFIRDKRYCVPCDALRDMIEFETHCKCGAPWDRPVTEAA